MIQALIIAGSFLLGKGLSLLVYRSCWEANDNRIKKTLLYYCLWLPILTSLVILQFSNWNELPVTQIIATVTALQLAFATVGRFDPGRPVGVWHIVTISLAILVYWHPGWLVVSLLCTCLLQYRLASWGLSPGYSNLLGFEFSRSSACSLISTLTVTHFIFPKSQDQLVLTALILHQASYYINHALAKNAIGKSWYEWMNCNRIQYLFSNAWLRGWTLGQDKSTWLKIYQQVAKYRISICWAAWGIEIGWLFVLLHENAPLYLYSIAIAFHLMILLLTGLSCWHYLINHLCILYIFSQPFTLAISPHIVLAALIAWILAAIWVGLVRTKWLTSHRSENKTTAGNPFADASDHLMAWWDSPLMRMYSYTIETTSGKQYFLPVTKLSPHDTVITDIHTSLMILNLHKGFDPKVEQDKKIAQTGVWGLLANRDERDKLYSSEAPSPDLPERNNNRCESPAWVIHPKSDHPALPLLQHFQAINNCIQKPWYRWILKWPHFPGEDHAPDLCLLTNHTLTPFTMDEPIKVVKLWSVKTWASDDGFSLLDHSLCGEIHLSTSN